MSITGYGEAETADSRAAKRPGHGGGPDLLRLHSFNHRRNHRGLSFQLFSPMLLRRGYTPLIPETPKKAELRGCVHRRNSPGEWKGAKQTPPVHR